MLTNLENNRNSELTYKVLDGFHDPIITPVIWDSLLTESNNDIIFMTWRWQKTWWEILGHGKLLLVAAFRNGRPVAIAPLFSDEGMIFFVGSTRSDFLDFIGCMEDDTVLEGMINLAIHNVPGFLGCRFYNIPKNSPTSASLKQISSRLNMKFFVEAEFSAPKLCMKDNPDKAPEAINKKSLLRHERWFQQNGNLTIEHFLDDDIHIHLSDFFDQHVRRWAATPYKSLFNEPAERRFYERLCIGLSGTGWLRFTNIIWNGQSIASHFGYNYKGFFSWYKPSFDISLSRRSPGEVLLRQLIVRAITEGAHTFDFGLGDEAFKYRFSTDSTTVCTYGIYPAP